MNFLKLIGGVLLPFAFGCASMMPTHLQAPVDKIASNKPSYQFEGEMIIKLEGITFKGMASTKIKDLISFTIASPIKIQKAVINSCHRSVPVDASKPIEFRPTETEKRCMSGIYIQAWNDKGETDWGFIALASFEDMPTAAKGVECNSVKWTFREGYTTCQAKVGTIQQLKFDVPIKFIEADPECKMTALDDRTFELRPMLGECTVAASDGKRRHSAIFIGYERERQ